MECYCCGLLGLLVTLSSLIVSAAAGSRVKQVGNDVQASASGVDVAGVSFLLDDFVLLEGVLFAYSAFFRSNKPIRFQVWRPQAPTTNTVDKHFSLVGETRVIPSIINAREDVYIEAKLTEDCVRLRSGDRLGIFFEGAPGAVAYVFDANHPMALGHTVADVTEPVLVGETVRFDTLTFPYDFSMTAYIDTELQRYDDKDETPPCPRGLLIPDYIPPTLAPTTTPPPPTGRPGSTGETGPRGAIGATGWTGPMGGTGPEGVPGPAGIRGDNGRPGSPGSAGSTGPRGYSGIAGLPGATGTRGPAGPPGPPGPVLYGNGTVVARAASATDTAESALLYVLLVWTLVVTVAVVIIYCVILAARRRHGRKQRQSSMRSTYRPSWINALKEETETQYQPDTVSTASSGQTNQAFRRDSRFLPSFNYDPEPSTSNSITRTGLSSFR